MAKHDIDHQIAQLEQAVGEFISNILDSDITLTEFEEIIRHTVDRLETALRHKALEELVRLAQEMGEYDVEKG
jgi:hypothetical protein